MMFWLPKNPNVALMLVPWFVPMNQKLEDMMLELHGRLTNKPDDTFVCVAIEDNLIKGMVIAYCRWQLNCGHFLGVGKIGKPSPKDVFIWQARNQGLTRAMVDYAFNGVCLWARAKGFNRITSIPNRDARLWERRWGFKQQDSNILYKEI